MPQLKNRVAGIINEAKRNFARMKLERRMPLFKKLITDDKAWALYLMCIQNYITQCKVIKAETNLATASSEIKHKLELLDWEIKTLEWAIKVPQATINKVLIEEQKKTEADLYEEIETDLREE